MMEMDEVQKMVERIEHHQIAEGTSGKYRVKVEFERDKYAIIWKWQITILINPTDEPYNKTEVSFKHFRKKHDALNYFKELVTTYGLNKKG